MVNFETVINELVNIGFYDVVLVWLLFFGVVFGLLQKSRLLGEPQDARSINAIVSAAIAFFIILYNPGVVSKVVFYSTFFGSSAMVLSALLVIALFMGILGLELGGEGFWKDETMRKYIGPVVFLIVVLIGYALFSGALGMGTPGVNVGVSDDLLTMVFFVVFIVFVVWLATRKTG